MPYDKLKNLTRLVGLVRKRKTKQKYATKEEERSSDTDTTTDTQLPTEINVEIPEEKEIDRTNTKTKLSKQKDKKERHQKGQKTLPSPSDTDTKLSTALNVEIPEEKESDQTNKKTKLSKQKDKKERPQKGQKTLPSFSDTDITKDIQISTEINEEIPEEKKSDRTNKMTKLSKQKDNKNRYQKGQKTLPSPSDTDTQLPTEINVEIPEEKESDQTNTKTKLSKQKDKIERSPKGQKTLPSPSDIDTQLPTDINVEISEEKESDQTNKKSKISNQKDNKNRYQKGQKTLPSPSDTDTQLPTEINVEIPEEKESDQTNTKTKLSKQKDKKGRSQKGQKTLPSPSDIDTQLPTDINVEISEEKESDQTNKKSKISNQKDNKNRFQKGQKTLPSPSDTDTQIPTEINVEIPEEKESDHTNKKSNISKQKDKKGRSQKGQKTLPSPSDIDTQLPTEINVEISEEKESDQTNKKTKLSKQKDKIERSPKGQKTLPSHIDTDTQLPTEINVEISEEKESDQTNTKTKLSKQKDKKGRSQKGQKTLPSPSDIDTQLPTDINVEISEEKESDQTNKKSKISNQKDNKNRFQKGQKTLPSPSDTDTQIPTEINVEIPEEKESDHTNKKSNISKQKDKKGRSQKGQKTLPSPSDIDTQLPTEINVEISEEKESDQTNKKTKLSKQKDKKDRSPKGQKTLPSSSDIKTTKYNQLSTEINVEIPEEKEMDRTNTKTNLSKHKVETERLQKGQKTLPSSSDIDTTKDTQLPIEINVEIPEKKESDQTNTMTNVSKHKVETERHQNGQKTVPSSSDIDTTKDTQLPTEINVEIPEEKESDQTNTMTNISKHKVETNRHQKGQKTPPSSSDIDTTKDTQLPTEINVEIPQEKESDQTNTMTNVSKHKVETERHQKGQKTLPSSSDIDTTKDTQLPTEINVEIPEEKESDHTNTMTNVSKHKVETKMPQKGQKTLPSFSDIDTTKDMQLPTEINVIIPEEQESDQTNTMTNVSKHKVETKMHQKGQKPLPSFSDIDTFKDTQLPTEINVEIPEEKEIDRTTTKTNLSKHKVETERPQKGQKTLPSSSDIDTTKDIKLPTAINEEMTEEKESYKSKNNKKKRTHKRQNERPQKRQKILPSSSDIDTTKDNQSPSEINVEIPEKQENDQSHTKTKQRKHKVEKERSQKRHQIQPSSSDTDTGHETKLPTETNIEMPEKESYKSKKKQKKSKHKHQKEKPEKRHQKLSSPSDTDTTKDTKLPTEINVEITKETESDRTNTKTNLSKNKVETERPQKGQKTLPSSSDIDTTKDTQLPTETNVEIPEEKESDQTNTMTNVSKHKVETKMPQKGKKTLPSFSDIDTTKDTQLPTEINVEIPEEQESDQTNTMTNVSKHKVETKMPQKGKKTLPSFSDIDTTKDTQLPTEINVEIPDEQESDQTNTMTNISKHKVETKMPQKGQKPLPSFSDIDTFKDTQLPTEINVEIPEEKEIDRTTPKTNLSKHKVETERPQKGQKTLPSSSDIATTKDIKLPTAINEEMTEEKESYKSKKNKKKRTHKHQNERPQKRQKILPSSSDIDTTKDTQSPTEINVEIPEEQENDQSHIKTKQRKHKVEKERPQKRHQIQPSSSDTDTGHETKLPTETNVEMPEGESYKSKKKQKKSKHKHQKEKPEKRHQTLSSPSDTDTTKDTKLPTEINVEITKETESDQNKRSNQNEKNAYLNRETLHEKNTNERNQEANGNQTCNHDEICDDLAQADNTFEFDLDQNTWSNIAPETRLYSNGRHVRRLKNNWTDVFSENVNKVHPGCVLKFERHYVTKESTRKIGAAVISATANCKGKICSASFNFTMSSQYSNQPARVSCEVVGNIKHVSDEINRRNISGNKRQELAGTMKSANETFLENLLTADSEQINLGNFTTVPTTKTLRKIIQEEIKKDHLHSDIIRGLQLLKESYEKDNIPYIREISVDPFTVILISDEQIEFMKKHNLNLYIDATGSIIGNIVKQKRPFLYSVVAKPDPTLPEVSLGDMITTQHNIPKLEYFFNVMMREVRQKGGKLDVGKIESDYSFAIIQACLKSFSNCNLKEYLNKCGEIVMGVGSQAVFTVHHLCAAHMIKDFLRNLKKESPKAQKKQREVATKLFAMLQNSTTLTEAKLIYQNACKMFLNHQYTDDVQNAVKFTDIALDFQQVEIESNGEEDFRDTLDVDDDVEGKTIKQSSPFTSVFEKIKEVVARQISADLSGKCPHNSLYSPEIVSCFERFLPIYPLWSGLLLNRFSEQTRDTNSAAETWFKSVKHDMGIGLRSRPEQFVMALRKLAHGRLRVLQFPNARKPRRKRKKGVDEKLELKEEQWKEKKKKQKKTSKYYEKSSKTTNTKAQSLPSVMKWGGESHNVSLSNTCTIDNGLTILHLFSLQHTTFLVNEENQFCKTLLSIFKMMNEQSFAEAKLIWVNFNSSHFIKHKPGDKEAMLTNLYGDETDFFMYAIDQTWLSRQKSRCTRSDCCEQRNLNNDEHGIRTGLQSRISSVQEVVDSWMLTKTPCTPSVDIDEEGTNQVSETVCSGERSYEREIIQCSPVAAIRVYEYCLVDRISLDDILNSKQVNINGRVYHLAGITMHRGAHYCAIVMFNKKLLWYDGLLGRLVVLPKNLQEWFPSHMIYCCV